MAITLNTQGSCTSDARGTGLGSCVKQYGDLLGIDAYTKGWSLDTTSGTLPTESEYVDLIKAGTIKPLNNLFNFEQNTPDNEFATGSTGKKAEIRGGKPEYALSWDLGGCFQKNLYSLKGTGKWDIAFKFETGILWATNVSETKLKAYDSGMFSVSTFKFQQGTDPEMSTATFQFNSPEEINGRQVFYTWEELGYDMNQIDGVINTNVTFETAPTTSTTVNVKVLDDCNRSVSILGLEVSDFTLGGTQATATSIDTAVYNSDGYYVLTLDAALESADTISIKIAEAGTEAAENTSGDLYGGISAVATVA